MSTVVITMECDNCENEMEMVVTDLSNDIPRISWDFASQTTFQCDKCGNQQFTGDFEYESDDSEVEEDEEEV